ncbi:hypothetical protein HW452_14470 [Halomonas aquamarina]|uniref:Uncharacterized protein n=1 Tax=Vreelandella aquamarina TaxID=77097 RepID=A0ACC5VXV8_9GAMM|nr:toxin VasX [Halomonas aquamarina]MBZ5488729.1 hypothetical protein [Halomonas aquamarina]
MSQELSQHKACEEPKLFIQVLGTEHPEGHRFVFFDETDQQEQVALVESVEEEDLPKPLSRIHSWEWETEPARNVWLEIDSEEGDSIQVPLFREVEGTSWQESETEIAFQHYVVQPVIPMASWRSVQEDSIHALPSRPGYLYLYYQERIWREIEIGVSEDGEWQFKDVPLASYRQDDNSFSENERPPTGISLKEIWLPARENQHWLAGEIKAAFSDVQWSAARLNYVEANPDACAQRFQSVTLNEPQDNAESGYLFSAEQLPPQRERTMVLEVQLSHPPMWSEDLVGNTVTELYQLAKEEQQQFKAGETAISQEWLGTQRGGKPLDMEAGLRAAACQDVNGSNLSELQDDEEGNLVWESLPEGKDVFEDARQRHIPGLVLNDPLFDLRHALNQTQQAFQFLSLWLEQCASHPHYRSALLVQKRIRPSTIGGEDNPLYSYANEPELRDMTGPFHTAIATLARAQAHHMCQRYQNHLAELIGQVHCQHALADYFSLEGADYISGFCIAEQCFTALSLNSQHADLLANQEDIDNEVSEGLSSVQQTLIGLLEEGSSAPLHRMCFPDTASHPVEEPFVLADEETNDGSGRFRAKALSDESQRADSPPLEGLQTTEVSLLAAAARFNTVGELNRWSGAMDNIFGRIADSGKSVLSQIADQGERTAMAARIYMPAFNASRGALHTLLGDLTFQPLGNVDMSRYALLGVEDVRSGMLFGLDSADRTYIARNNHRQFYGEIYRTSNGELLGGTNQSRLRSIKNIGEAREVRFIFAPIDSEAAEMVRQGRERIGFTERAIGATRLPYLMVVFQALNLGQSSVVLFENYNHKKLLGVVSAIVDLGLASLNLSDYMSRRYQVPKPIVSVSELSQRVVIKNGQASFLTRLFPNLIRVNWVLGKFAGVLAAGTMVWESLERLKEGNTGAAIAYGVAAAGATMVLLFSGPVGWVGLALLVGGAISGIVLTDGPIKQWLKHGPFGEQRGLAPWLEDPEEACYRLENLLANITITGRRITPQERTALMDKLSATHNQSAPTAYTMGHVWREQLQQLQHQSINTVIEVQSSLPGMGIELQDIAIIKRLKGKTHNTPASQGWSKQSELQITPLLTKISNNSVNYFVHTPAEVRAWANITGTAYRWEVHVQFREVAQIPFLSTNRFYPAPKPLKAMPSDISAVFSGVSLNEDFWVKEVFDV